MTVDQLVAILLDLNAQGKGGYQVVTRGSKATTFVDASNVRATKTATRKVVFIGKPKAVTAD